VLNRIIKNKNFALLNMALESLYILLLALSNLRRI